MESGAQVVVRTIVGGGVKHLVEITVDVDGDAGGATASVTATEGHPFWLPESRRWVSAGELRVGSLLQTSAGTWVQVVQVAKRTATQRAHNLTVNALHTYHVLTGATPVLVHNCGGTATVRWDTDMQHATIKVEANGMSLETEQVIPGWDGRGNPNGLHTTADGAEPLGTNVIERSFDLPDAGAAMRAQQASIGANLGIYDGLHNSCVTYCVGILRAGGVDIPPGVRGVVALKRTLG
ncbi:polymorphic toxin-type HINT domain-containing protein [Goodfellowiella coeruleoviolacea]|uniref:polymorphic toxin-type HINT domain-containing protein n=1 Tax=Goodfellowiella coeruleoviolacea TaxID=334858 RepID=UPI0020A5ECF1|nr:polymorphic toxin-type HINT domain-containing protein [Goodfellowiella coeruleoviolacea]